MPLVLAPVELEDFDTIISHADVYDPGDDLVAPPNPVAWPVKTREDAQRRLRFVMAKQRRRFQQDSTARYVKVVDVDIDPSTSGAKESSASDEVKGDIVSIARWHFFPKGYDFESMSHWERAELIPNETEWPQGFNRDLHDFILLTRDRARRDWIGEGQPAWILMHLVTRTSHRGRGAAGLLIKWGVSQSEKSKVPAYLEAGALGKPVYERYGFRQVGELRKLDLRPYGVDVSFELANMTRYPSSLNEASIPG